MKKAFPEPSCKLSHASLAITRFFWQPIAEMKTKKIVFSFFAYVVEGERKRALGVDVELAS